MQLTGIHHLTAITARAADNVDFYTRVLGLRLVKKTVNQDDVTAYHLFYGDGKASPGTDITFFDFPAPPEQRGTRSICLTGFRVAGEATLQWWQQRLAAEGVTQHGIIERDHRLTLDFEDPEGQRLSLVDDGGQGSAHPWEQSPVPPEHQIRGLGPIMISVPDTTAIDVVLTQLMQMQAVREYRLSDDEQSLVHVYQMGDGGPAAELHVAVQPHLPMAREGAGGVHHVAFRIPDHAYDHWTERLQQVRLPSSGPVDRYYFRSLYFREPNRILFEIATDGPGFDVDEPMETLGEKLVLPPFLEHRREDIEAGLKPL